MGNKRTPRKRKCGEKDALGLASYLGKLKSEFHLLQPTPLSTKITPFKNIGTRMRNGTIR
jgi:hypothetical protein